MPGSESNQHDAGSRVSNRQVFLFLQGPLSPFFAELAEALERRGHRTLRINVCIGDVLFWRRRGGVNFRGRPQAWPQFIKDFLRREGVTDIVLLGEQRFYQKVAVSAAKRMGISVTVTDFGYLRPDWLTLERDGMSGKSRFPRDMQVIRELASNATPPDGKAKYVDSFQKQAFWDVAFHLSNSFLNLFSFPFYHSYQLHSPLLAYLGTGLRLLRRKECTAAAERVIDRLHDDKTPYFVLPMQMENDFQIRAYSPFPDMRTPIREAIRSLAANGPKDAHLVVKIHPLDPGLRRWAHIVSSEAKAAGMDGRVHFIDGGALNRLIAGSRGVVTVNSTVGIWALRALKPVITLGTAIFDIDGLTYQGGLDRFWTEATAPKVQDVQDFVTALAETIQIRGVYYNQPGLNAAVEAAVKRLDHGEGETIDMRFAISNLLQNRPRRVLPIPAPSTAVVAARTGLGDGGLPKF